MSHMRGPGDRISLKPIKVCYLLDKIFNLLFRSANQNATKNKLKQTLIKKQILIAEATANLNLITWSFIIKFNLIVYKKKLMKSMNFYKTQSELLTKEILSM